LCIFALRRSIVPDPRQKQALSHSEQKQNQDSHRKTWEAPKLETLEVSATETGTIQIPFENFFQFLTS
jgi:hypothetical protein